MKQTANHKLNKPDYTDIADIADINANMDIIDENLGRVTTATYTDEQNNKYIDVNGMHIRTDNSIYAKGGIKVVADDPCTNGANITEDDVTANHDTSVLAEINENGDAELNNVDMNNAKANEMYIRKKIYTSGADFQGRALHFTKTKGAMYADNSGNTKSDGSRKFIVGAYKDTPETDSNGIPTTTPDAGVVARVESDPKSGTYVELYGKNIVSRTEDATIRIATVSANTVVAGEELKVGDLSVAEMINAKADSNHTHSADDLTGTLPIAKGGTGAATAEEARSALGLGTAAVKNATTTITNGGADLITSGAVYKEMHNLNANKSDRNHTHTSDDLTGTLPISKGGTGATTAAEARNNLGLATVAVSGSYNDLSDKPNTGKGATVYTINSNTFTSGITMGGKPYAEIHHCKNRIVYVGTLSNSDKQKARNCGLFLYSASDVQGTIGIQVNTTPTSDIKLVVVDLGAFSCEGNNAIVIDGLPDEQIVTDSES